MERRHVKQTVSLSERCSQAAHRLKVEAKKNPRGPEREQLLRKARQFSTAAHFDEWLRSHGLPTK